MTCMPSSLMMMMFILPGGLPTQRALSVFCERLEEAADEIYTELRDVFDVFLGDVFPVLGLLPEELSDEKGIEVSGELPTACLDEVLFDPV